MEKSKRDNVNRNGHSNAIHSSSISLKNGWNRFMIYVNLRVLHKLIKTVQRRNSGCKVILVYDEQQFPKISSVVSELIRRWILEQLRYFHIFLPNLLFL